MRIQERIHGDIVKDESLYLHGLYSIVLSPLSAPIYCFIQSDLKYIKNKKFKPSYYFMLLDSVWYIFIFHSTFYFNQKI